MYTHSHANGRTWASRSGAYKAACRYEEMTRRAVYEGTTSGSFRPEVMTVEERDRRAVLAAESYRLAQESAARDKALAAEFRQSIGSLNGHLGAAVSRLCNMSLARRPATSHHDPVVELGIKAYTWCSADGMVFGCRTAGEPTAVVGKPGTVDGLLDRAVECDLHRQDWRMVVEKYTTGQWTI